MIDDDGFSEPKHFCCKGCQGVYHLLQHEGLDSFYEKKGEVHLTPATHVASDDLAKFDLEGFKKRYVKMREDGFEEIALIIEGIHCSACVWLNEKVLHTKEGVIEATINYSNNKAKVVWDGEEITLSQIIETIRSIGYNAYPYDPALQEERAVKQRREYYAKLLVGIFATMNIMWLAIAQYAGYFSGGMLEEYRNVLNYAEWFLSSLALFYTGWAFYKGAYFGLKNRMITMDFLIATGASLAYIYSIYATLTRYGEVYFDSVTMIITFVFIGKYMEVLSKKRAVDTLDTLRSSYPTEVLVVRDDVKSLISVEEVKVGDIIELKAGDKCVVDGVIVNGEASFDESSLTGESKPIYKGVGESVVSGSVNIDAVIRYQTTKEYADSTFSTIISLLEESMTKKPRIERLANSISGYFSVVILMLAIGTFAVWYFKANGFEQALIVSISVVVIACPCALGLATPVATLIGVSSAAKKGIIFKEAEFFETMAKSDVLLLDKTGTITEGRPMVIDHQRIKPYDPNLLFSLVSSSTHPVSIGVKEFLLTHGEEVSEIKLDSVKNIKSSGMSASYQGLRLDGGNHELMQMQGVQCDIESSETIFIYAVDGEIVAYFELRDSAKEGAKESIEAIKTMGLEIAMLTGDNEQAARKIADEVGIERVHAKLTPQDKAEIVKVYQKRGKIVIMAGDGINDAIALSLSDISVAMGSGTDTAISVSDVVILDDRLDSLQTAMGLSRKTYRTIKENLGLSLGYNTLALPLAMMGYVQPFVAALSMSLSSLLVIGNSMRIKGGYR
jgi:Cu+-exporting ATPase